MEKTRIEVKAYRSYAEMFYMWAFAGLAALLLEFTLSSMILRKVP